MFIVLSQTPCEKACKRCDLSPYCYFRGISMGNKSITDAIALLQSYKSLIKTHKNHEEIYNEIVTVINQLEEIERNREIPDFEKTKLILIAWQLVMEFLEYLSQLL